VINIQLMASMNRVAQVTGDVRGARVISLLEGGYDTNPETQGLARCVDAHVAGLRNKL
jgi:acetoin utilization deacetylase AcuC-like enzyme